MNLNQLIGELDRRGGDLARWPDGLAAAARRLAADDPAAAARLDEAQALDALLTEALTAPPLPLGYATRIAARAAEAAAPRRWFDPRWFLALGSSWAAAAVMAGVVYADLLEQADPELLTFAEAALSASQLLSGN